LITSIEFLLKGMFRVVFPVFFCLTFTSVFTEPLSLEIKNFLDAIDGKDDLLVKPEQAVNVTKIAEAALLSSQRGTPIYLDLR